MQTATIEMQAKTKAINTDTKFWDGISRKYAKSKIGDVDGYERTLARAAELIKQTDAAVELGCGTGSTALRLAPHAASYLATDLSPGMIEIAREKLFAEKHGAETSVEGAGASLSFEAATAETVTVPEDGYDVALGFNYLHLVPDLQKTLGAVNDLLKPGGLFISKTPCLKDMNPLIRLAIPVMRAFGKAPASVQTFSRDELAKALAMAGFKIEATEFHGTKGKDIRPFIVARKG